MIESFFMLENFLHVFHIFSLFVLVEFAWEKSFRLCVSFASRPIFGIV